VTGRAGPLDRGEEYLMRASLSDRTHRVR